MEYVSYNGRFYPANAPLVSAQNRSFRYGDGLFETMKVINGHIRLPGYHFDRLWLGLRLLQIEVLPNFTRQTLQEEIVRLCNENNLLQAARVRLAVYRNENNLAEYVIEAANLPAETGIINEKGWALELYPFARKSCDAIANLKTANYLIYVLAGLYAKEKEVDECLVLNTENNICDASKTNVFLIHENSIYTPALHQGCVNGVMRRYMVEHLKDTFPVHQREISEEFLLQADEVFLTNAINGIRWVASYRGKQYGNEIIKEIYKRTGEALYH